VAGPQTADTIAGGSLRRRGGEPERGAVGRKLKFDAQPLKIFARRGDL
jgi:hypothetical protein